MKFRAKATDFSFIRTFSQLLLSLSRMSRSFVLRITPDKLIFVLNDKEAANATTAISAWGEVPRDPYFAEYAMEGVSQKDNEIFLEISPEKIAGCLSTLRSPQSVSGLKIKLTKKVVACLTFEIEYNCAGSAQTCIHDVPVTLVLRRMWSQFTDPDVPPFDVSIGMPEMKNVRLAIERVKNIGPRLKIAGTKSGKLRFSVDTCNVKCTVGFNQLRTYEVGENASEAQETEREENSAGEYSVEVDMKSIMHIVSSDLNRPSNFIFSICNNTKLHVYFLYGDISLQYCLPSIGDPF